MDTEVKALVEEAGKKYEAGMADAKAAKEATERLEKALDDMKKDTASAKELEAVKTELETNVKTIREFIAAEGRRGNTDKVVKTFGGMIFDLVANAQKDLEDMAAGRRKNVVREFDRKAVTDMTLATNLTGVGVISYRAGIVDKPFLPVHFRDLVAVVPSATDNYHFFRHTTSEGTIAFQTDETAFKAKIDEDYLEVTVNLNYLAGWLKVSRKMLRNLPGLQSQLSRWLPERYYQAEDAAAYAALSGAVGLTPPVVGANNVDTILLTIGAIEDKGYSVNGIAMRPSAWAVFMTNASTDGIYTLPGSVVLTPQGGLQFVGIPIVKARFLPANTAVVGDWSRFEIVQSEALSLRWSDENENDFIRNMMTALIEASVGFAVLDPAAFSIVTLTAPTT